MYMVHVLSLLSSPSFPHSLSLSVFVSFIYFLRITTIEYTYKEIGKPFNKGHTCILWSHSMLSHS